MNAATQMSRCWTFQLIKPSPLQSFLTNAYGTSRTTRPHIIHHPQRITKRTQVSIGFDQPREFKPFVPPSPSSLPPPRPPKQYRRLIKYGRRLLIFAGLGGTAYLVDRFYNFSALTRSLRTFYLGLQLTIDYKLNFKEKNGDKIHDLHHRSADRVFDVLSANGGLYLKVGQAIAMQAAVLPPAYQKKFAKLFDDAPQASYEAILKVFQQEFGGKTPDEVFLPGSFEHQAVASASIAQVHRARLKDGTLVAVKIQKPEIATWVTWDLRTWSILTWLESKFFDLNYYFVVPYIRERLTSECDFNIEAENSERTKAYVESEPSIRDKVYIPKVFKEVSTKRVMVAEWIDGVKLWDKEAISGPWKGKEMVGKEIGKRRAHKAQSVAKEFSNLFESSSQVPQDMTIRRAGLGLSQTDIMTTIVRLFACQMFYWGHVHCDPHPGNILVRRKPNGKSEVVLIDHGLYVDMSEKMRKSYCEFWTSLLTFDNEKIAEVAESWGIGNADLFASATLLRPYQGGDGSFSKSITGKGDPNGPGGMYEMHERMTDGLKQFLNDTDKIPRELVFLGRSMRIIQGNNQLMGSPVNRIKETGMAASRGLLTTETKNPKLAVTWRQKFRAYWKYCIFRVVMLSSDIVFFTVRLRQKLRLGEGFEDELETRMRAMAKSEFGIELQSSPFEG